MKRNQLFVMHVEQYPSPEKGWWWWAGRSIISVSPSTEIQQFAQGDASSLELAASAAYAAIHRTYKPCGCRADTKIHDLRVCTL